MKQAGAEPLQKVLENGQGTYGGGTSIPHDAAAAGDAVSTPAAAGTLNAVRKRHIEIVLGATDYDLAEAARILKISYPELRRLMARLEIGHAEWEIP